jgi:ribosome recycling factor
MYLPALARVQVRIRRVRTEGLKEIKSEAKEGGIGKDDVSRMEKHVGMLVDVTVGEVDDMLAAKVAELSGKR